MLIQGEGGPRRPAQGRRYLERAAALGEVDGLKVLAHALSHGQYSFERSRIKAQEAKRALRRALSRLRNDADTQELMDARGAVVRGSAGGCGIRLLRDDRWSGA
jgi:hypothetical protein